MDDKPKEKDSADDYETSAEKGWSHPDDPESEEEVKEELEEEKSEEEKEEADEAKE